MLSFCFSSFRSFLDATNASEYHIQVWLTLCATFALFFTNTFSSHGCVRCMQNTHTQVGRASKRGSTLVEVFKSNGKRLLWSARTPFTPSSLTQPHFGIHMRLFVHHLLLLQLSSACIYYICVRVCVKCKPTSQQTSINFSFFSL